MRNHRKILITTAAILSATSLTVARPALASVDSVEQELMQMNNEFEVGNGEHFTLYYGHHPKNFRICLNDAPGVVPLNVQNDGKPLEILDGTCQDVTGSDIVIGPAAKLTGDTVLFGKFEPKTR